MSAAEVAVVIIPTPDICYPYQQHGTTIKMQMVQPDQGHKVMNFTLHYKSPDDIDLTQIPTPISTFRIIMTERCKQSLKSGC